MASRDRSQTTTNFSFYKPDSTLDELKAFLVLIGFCVTHIVSQGKNQGGWTVTLKEDDEKTRNLESDIDTCRLGKIELFIDPRDKSKGFWSIRSMFFFDLRKKPDDKPQPAAKRVSFQEPLTQKNFPPLGKKSPKAKSVGGSWAAKAATPAAKPNSIQELIKQAMERKANAQKMKAEAEKEEEAAEKELQELLKKAEDETKKLQELLQVLRPSAAAEEVAN